MICFAKPLNSIGYTDQLYVQKSGRRALDGSAWIGVVSARMSKKEVRFDCDGRCVDCAVCVGARGSFGWHRLANCA